MIKQNYVLWKLLMTKLYFNPNDLETKKIYKSTMIEFWTSFFLKKKSVVYLGNFTTIFNYLNLIIHPT